MLLGGGMRCWAIHNFSDTTGGAITDSGSGAGSGARTERRVSTSLAGTCGSALCWYLCVILLSTVATSAMRSSSVLGGTGSVGNGGAGNEGAGSTATGTIRCTAETGC